MFVRNNKKTKLAFCKRVDTDVPVKSQKLSISPTEAYELSKQGRPISASMLSAEYFNDGAVTHTFDIPLESQRGIDVNHLWQNEKDLARKSKRFKDGVNVHIKQTLKTE